MSLASSPKAAMDRACIGKAVDQPCNVTDDNLAPDCYETMHAFKKIRNSTSGLRKSPNKWTKEENQKLAALVASYGEKKWKRISAEMGGQKTGAQCAQHWKRVLSPEIRKGHWDENEEDLLLRLVVQYGSCWKKIAKKIPQRTDIQCRYQYLKAKQSREVSWDSKEDESLLKKVMEMANCNFFSIHDTSSDNSPNTSPSCTSLRDASNYNTNSASTNGTSISSSSSSISSDASNKENDLSSSSGSVVKEDDLRSSGECGKDTWNDAKQNVNMSDSGIPHDTGSSWRSSSKEPSSLSGFCVNCHRPVGSHVNKIVWLEISEHMARLKLTSTLRTALECKTRFNELMGNKFSFPANNNFCLNSPESNGKHFDLKHGGQGNGPENRNGFHNNLDNIGIKINNSNKIPTTPNNANTNGCNSNNINLTNCNNNNITINITNSYTTANQNGITFQQIAHCPSAPSPIGSNSSPLKAEHILPHLLPKTPIPPILSPAPPFPSFSHLPHPSFPHLPQPNSTSLKPANFRSGSLGGVLNVNMGVGGPSSNGLESLAAVASILPREMLADYAQF